MLPALAAAVALAGCGGSSGPSFPTIGAANVYEIVKFEPAGKIEPGKATPISFEIKQPDGTPLTKFKRGPGPHTGVHLIYVRKDLSTIIHHHPPVGADGLIRDSVTFPGAGPYRLVIDVYPAGGSTGANGTPPASASGTPAATNNFQLFHPVEVAGTYDPAPLPATTTADTVDGYRFALQRRREPEGDPGPARPRDRDRPERPAGRVRGTTTARGRTRSSSARARSTTSTPTSARRARPAARASSAATKVTGTSSTPGKLTVGVLVPVAGTWRLFLQVDVGDRVLTAPFTLKVS